MKKNTFIMAYYGRPTNLTHDFESKKIIIGLYLDRFGKAWALEILFALSRYTSLEVDRLTVTI